MFRRHLTTAVVYVACFLNIVPCLMITGCSQHLDTKPTSSQSVDAPTKTEQAAREDAARVVAKHNTAATTIQKALSAYNVRKQSTAKADVEIIARAEETAATTIQKALSAYNVRKQSTAKADVEIIARAEETAATTIQKALSAYNVRKQSTAKADAEIVARAGVARAEETAATTTIQKTFRKYQAVQKLKQEKENATKIQALVRGKLTRDNLTERHTAAADIQSVFRGYNVRAAAEVVREEEVKGDVSGSEAVPEGSTTSCTSDLSDDEDGANNTTDGHTQAAYVVYNEETIAKKEMYQTPERGIRGNTLITASIAERDANSEEGRAKIRDVVLNLVGSDPKTIEDSKDVTPARARNHGRQMLKKLASMERAGKNPDETKDEDDNWSTTDCNHAYRDLVREHAKDSTDETEDEDSSWSIADYNHAYRDLAKEYAENSTDEDDDWSTTDDSDTSDNDTESNDGYTNIPFDARLSSMHMRGYITKKFPDFAPSVDSFEAGDIRKPIFFCKEDVGRRKEKVYIAFAHNQEKDSEKALTSGEESLQTVLEYIKKDLEDENRNSKAPIRLLVPLQQIRKEHWTLLEIKIASLLEGRAAATHYDSKGKRSFSYARDFRPMSNAPARINTWVREFLDNRDDSKKKVVAFKYDGVQPFIDNKNCGRFVLIKLHSLLDPGAQRLSIDDINKVLNAGAQTNAQVATTQTKEKGPRQEFKKTSNSRADDELSTLSRSSSASADWEEIAE